MEQLITALELRAEAIAEEIEALEALANHLDDPYRSRVSSLLLRIGRRALSYEGQPSTR